jgi:hypothetical protein
VEHSDDRRQLILKAGRSAGFPQCKSSVLKRLEDAERLVEIEDYPGGTGSSSVSSLLSTAGVCPPATARPCTGSPTVQPDPRLGRVHAPSRPVWPRYDRLVARSERTTHEHLAELDDADRAWLSERLVEYRELLAHLRDH